MDDLLFKNPHEALIFAFRFSTQQYAISPMAKLAQTGILGSGKGLNGLDGAAQAGFVMAEVGRLSSLHRSCIIARYSIRYEACKCCGADKVLQEYAEAMANLREWALSTFTGLSVRQMREAIVRGYYERGISIGKIADDLNVPRRTAYAQKEKIWAALKQMDDLAQQEIAARLDRMCESGEGDHVVEGLAA